MENFFATNSQKQILNRIFSLNLNLLCIIDIKGIFVKVNNAWKKTLGYEAHELEGSNIVEFVHPDDRDATIFIFKEMLRTNHRLSFSNRFRAKNGCYRFIEWEFNHHDQYAYVSGIDITDIKTLEHDANELRLHHHQEFSSQTNPERCSIRQTILIVDDSPLNTKILETALQDDYDLIICHSGQEALDLLSAHKPPDLILLDIVLPDISGYDICKALNQELKTQDIPLFFLSSLDETKDIEYGLGLGAIDYITKPFSMPVVKAKIHNHMKNKHEWDSMKHIKDLDPLTQIGNRRYFDKVFKSEVERAKRIESVMSFLLVDIDHFKFYNDTYGHVEGDQCLKAVATVLSENLEGTRDVVARWGGEEFVCLLPDTDCCGAQKLAERLRQAILTLAIPHMASPIDDIITISIGVVTSDRNNTESFDILLKRADEALYEAKKSGRNQFCTWCEDIVSEGAYI